MIKTNYKLIRKLKYYSFKFRFPSLFSSNKFNFIGHASSLDKWINKYKNIAYTNFPDNKFVYQKRYGLFKHIINTEIKNQPIDYLEFGVAKGSSFRWWVNEIKHPDTKFCGFDTFTGLPEDWGGFKKGDMSNGNKPPQIYDKRCQFYQGIFQKTLSTFIKQYGSSKKKVIHMDADLYSSTLFVLTSLSPYIKKGDIIIFDEFNVPLHEYKAFKDWTESYYINYTVLGETNNFYQMALRIE